MENIRLNEKNFYLLNFENEFKKVKLNLNLNFDYKDT